MKHTIVDIFARIMMAHHVIYSRTFVFHLPNYLWLLLELYMDAVKYFRRRHCQGVDSGFSPLLTGFSSLFSLSLSTITPIHAFVSEVLAQTIRRALAQYD